MKVPLKHKPLRRARGPKKRYSEDNFKAALAAAKALEMSVRDAAILYGVPRSTLQDRLNDKHGEKDGRPTVLSHEEEREVVELMKLLGDWRFPASATDLLYFIKSYLDKKGVVTIFKDNLPSYSFIDKFVRRHKDLTMRSANPIKRSRAAVTREEVKAFMDNWEQTIQGVPPSAIFNYDETNMRDDPGCKKCLFRKGTKYPEKALNTSKQAYSVMFCGSADGHMMPPMIVYKAQNVYESWTERGPKGAKYSFSKSGWFDSFQFQKWFFGIMLPMLKRIVGRKVLLGDNLASHINSDVIKACRENQIEFVCLPPNSTDKLQPLDVAVFAPLKDHWRAVLTQFKVQNPTLAGISKANFPPLLKKVLDKANLGNHLPNGFKTCGLFPVDIEKACRRIPSRDMAVDTLAMRELMNSTLGEKLEELRGLGKPKARQIRGKKLKVPPGKSFTALDSSSSSEEDSPSETDSLTVADSPTEVERAESEAEEEMEEPESLPSPPRKQKQPKKAEPACQYIVGQYVAAVYNHLWYIAQVEGEEEEEEVENYTLLRYMNR